MKRRPGNARLLTLAAGSLCALSLAAPAAAAAGHQGPAQRAGAAKISLGSASALAGYFQSGGGSRDYNSTGGTVTFGVFGTAVSQRQRQLLRLQRPSRECEFQRDRHAAEDQAARRARL